MVFLGVSRIWWAHREWIRTSWGRMTRSAGATSTGRLWSVRTRWISLKNWFCWWRATWWCSAESRSVVTGSIAADLVSGGRTPIHPFVNQPGELDWSFPGLAAGGHGVFQFDRPTHVSRLNQCFARGHGGNGVPTALVQGPPQTGWTWWGRLTGGARLRCRRCHGQRARVFSVRSPVGNDPMVYSNVSQTGEMTEIPLATVACDRSSSRRAGVSRSRLGTAASGGLPTPTGAGYLEFGGRSGVRLCGDAT